MANTISLESRVASKAGARCAPYKLNPYGEGNIDSKAFFPFNPTYMAVYRKLSFPWSRFGNRSYKPDCVSPACKVFCHRAYNLYSTLSEITSSVGAISRSRFPVGA